MAARYPASIAVFAVSYWAFFEWEKKAGKVGLVVGVFFAIIGLGLVRELFLGILKLFLGIWGVVELFGWGILLVFIARYVFLPLCAAVAVLPVSVAILIGAIIIANAVRR